MVALFSMTITYPGLYIHSTDWLSSSPSSQPYSPAKPVQESGTGIQFASVSPAVTYQPAASRDVSTDMVAPPASTRAAAFRSGSTARNAHPYHLDNPAKRLSKEQLDLDAIESIMVTIYNLLPIHDSSFNPPPDPDNWLIHA